MNRSKLLIWLAGALIVVSVVAGWIAIGRLAEATERGMERIQVSLASARDLAADTASAAGEVKRIVPLVGESLSSTGDALAATREVSTSVRGLLDVASIFNRVEDLSNSLTAAEASIAEVEITLAEAAGSIEEAGPVLDQAVASLQGIPAELDQSIAAVEASRTRIGEQVWLWRLAMAAGGGALLLMLGLIAQLRGNVGVQASKQAPEAQP
jgi:methyl-accepting chemotaxis protein